MEVGMPEFLSQPCDAAALAALTGLTVPLVARLGEALVAAGLLATRATRLSRGRV